MADVFGAATTTPEGLYAAVQLAAWLHGAILRVAPYPSASGRTAHLLLDSVLGFFCPVPVFLRTAQRAAYQLAVTDFRESCLATDGGVMLTPPRMLTPLVLDALRGAWTRLWACMHAWHLPTTPPDCVYIGELVLKRAQLETGEVLPVGQRGPLGTKLGRCLTHSVRPQARMLPTDVISLLRAVKAADDAAAAAKDGAKATVVDVTFEDKAFAKVVLL